jgi:hypothetical protein
MRIDRFAILTYCDPQSLLNASVDEYGRPGYYARLLGCEPHAIKIIKIDLLPVSDEFQKSFPEGFRLLISYRLRE